MWLLLSFSLLGCRASLISIEDISSKEIDKTVYLAGNVVHVAPLVDRAAYQINDTTGTIWVITAQEPPKFGQQVNIKGKIQHQNLSFAGRQLGDFYVVELEQVDDLEKE